MNKEEFLSHIQINTNTSCWEWQGRLSNGYGIVRINCYPELAHRHSYRLFIGKIPGEMFICHKCDNRKCVNPEHLFIGTHQDNMDDMVAKGRHGGHPYSRRPDKDEENMIKELYEPGITQKDLADMFGVSISSISRLVRKARPRD